jgi:hypothetical protein
MEHLLNVGADRALVDTAAYSTKPSRPLSCLVAKGTRRAAFFSKCSASLVAQSPDS